MKFFNETKFEDSGDFGEKLLILEKISDFQPYEFIEIGYISDL